MKLTILGIHHDSLMQTKKIQTLVVMQGITPRNAIDCFLMIYSCMDLFPILFLEHLGLCYISLRRSRLK